MPDPRSNANPILNVEPCSVCGLAFRVKDNLRSDTNGAGWVHFPCFWELVQRGSIPAPKTLRDCARDLAIAKGKRNT